MLFLKMADERGKPTNNQASMVPENNNWQSLLEKNTQDVKDQLPILVADPLAADPGDRYDIILTDPPFGKKSSATVVGKDGKVSKEGALEQFKLIIEDVGLEEVE